MLFIPLFYYWKFFKLTRKTWIHTEVLIDTIFASFYVKIAGLIDQKIPHTTEFFVLTASHTVYHLLFTSFNRALDRQTSCENAAIHF